MTPELTALAAAALIQYAQLLVFGAFARRQPGTLAYQAGNRDAPPPYTGKVARAQRSMANHAESLILFAVAVIVVTLSGEATRLTAALAGAYVVARLLYVPAYVFGLAPVRSLVWGVGWVATLLMILAALF